MNWGYKILTVYIVFILGILFLVFGSAKQNTDLVTTDYYAKELVYQQRIDEMNRVAALSSPVTFEIRDGKLVIQFPSEFAGKQITGEAVLYCPSDKAGDVKKDFSAVGQTVELPMEVTGNRLYEFQLSWKAGTQTYYFSKKIFV